MREIHEYLVAQSEATSYNHTRNDTLDIIVTLIMLTPMFLVCAGLIYDLFASHNTQQRVLFGSVHPDER